MADKEAIIMISLMVFGMIASLYGMGWLKVLSYDGTVYHSTFTVIRCEHSNRFGEHTNVYVLDYRSGEAEGAVYGLKGYHDFQVGTTYTISFRNEAQFNWYKGFWFWGIVESMEVVS